MPGLCHRVVGVVSGCFVRTGILETCFYLVAVKQCSTRLGVCAEELRVRRLLRSEALGLASCATWEGAGRRATCGSGASCRVTHNPNIKNNLDRRERTSLESVLSKLREVETRRIASMIHRPHLWLPRVAMRTLLVKEMSADWSAMRSCVLDTPRRLLDVRSETESDDAECG